jgi:ethanolamine utilization microcompartment shell protein EutS
MLNRRQMLFTAAAVAVAPHVPEVFAAPTEAANAAADSSLKAASIEIGMRERSACWTTARLPAAMP